MRLRIYSDLHNEFSAFQPPPVATGVVVLAGDIDVKGRAIPWMAATFPGVAKIYVAGNHEFYGLNIEHERERLKAQARDHGVHFLDDDEVIIEGVRFLGGTLWTDYELYGKSRRPQAMLEAAAGMNDHRKIRVGGDYRKFMPADALHRHAQTVRFLQQKLAEPFGGTTVVVTHHAPSPRSIHPRYRDYALNTCFASDLEWLMGDAVHLWIHGHVHDSFDYRVAGTRVVANPRGYQMPQDAAPENACFDPGLSLEVPENVGPV